MMGCPNHPNQFLPESRNKTKRKEKIVGNLFHRPTEKKETESDKRLYKNW